MPSLPFCWGGVRPHSDPPSAQRQTQEFPRRGSEWGLTPPYPNVSQAAISPLSSPARNHRMRCSDVPCVNESGTT